MQTDTGYSLIELMAALGIAAAITAEALPALNEWYARTLITRDVDTFVSALHRARMSALSEATTITLCATGQPQQCDDSTDWSAGMIAWNDRNENHLVDTDESVSARWQPHSASVTSGKRLFRFNASGAGDMNHWTFCRPGLHSTLIRKVIINLAGRARIADPQSNTDGTPTCH